MTKVTLVLFVGFLCCVLIGLLRSLPYFLGIGEYKKIVEGDVYLNINEFASEVTRYEGKRKSINVAQVKEVLSIANRMLDGDLYRMIKERDFKNEI